MLPKTGMLFSSFHSVFQDSMWNMTNIHLLKFDSFIFFNFSLSLSLSVYIYIYIFGNSLFSEPKQLTVFIG